MKVYPVDVTIKAAWAIEVGGHVTLYVPAGLLTAAEEIAAIRRVSAVQDDEEIAPAGDGLFSGFFDQTARR